MVLDTLGAIAVTAIYSAVTGVLIAFSKTETRAKAGTFAAVTAWALLMIGVAAAGGFQPGVLGPVPGPVVAFAVFLFSLFACWRFLEGFRNALLNAPLPALIAVNIARLGGVFFLLLYTTGRLSSPFAPSAGWGDILAAFLAIPVAFAAREPQRYTNWIRLWNFVGAMDLVIAISLGFLSAQGTPFRVFTDLPGTLVLTTLPWVLIPTTIVPIFLLNHFVIATRLRTMESRAVKKDLASVPV